MYARFILFYFPARFLSAPYQVRTYRYGESTENVRSRQGAGKEQIGSR